ncbi:MerR family regulatory protein [Propionibacterium cyclohexanicum]|uniref:MerR family regulatory protein n=1 Tax=Propionibacterium cyclohexanicum TaxID=64702 RepID=A0A1H9QPL9_9ACTN|nr:MerR family transcriptional regulator [Propionibacterium cyclohexanicum]SER61683.1 MerR family regulatory protein [Propionibacterium cyclohexanicum]
MAQAPLRSIGQVLTILKAEFPDVSISKIRFLEGEGLVSPERAPSGYRKYSQADIDRLRYILRVQRDQYLPLKVIRENLELMDAGKEPPRAEPPPPPPVESSSGAAAERHENHASRPIRLTRRELLRGSGLPEARLIELERQQLVMPRRNSSYYGREALMICVVARKLQAYGMDTRHLRAIKQAAEREAGLVEQGVQPFVRNNPDAAHLLSEVSQLVIHAHVALMYTLLER